MSNRHPSALSSLARIHLFICDRTRRERAVLLSPSFAGVPPPLPPRRRSPVPMPTVSGRLFRRTGIWKPRKCVIAENVGGGGGDELGGPRGTNGWEWVEAYLKGGSTARWDSNSLAVISLHGSRAEGQQPQDLAHHRAEPDRRLRPISAFQN